jgi:hypothetical protein
MPVKILFFLLSLCIGIPFVKSQTAKNWDFDPKKNDISSVALRTQRNVFSVIHLGFSAEKKALLASFKQKSTSKSAYKKPILINGQPFTGEIVGKNEKEEVEFQVLLWEGLRYGEFMTKNAKGKELFHEFPKSSAQILSEPTFRNDQDRPVKEKPVIYLYPSTPTAVNVKVLIGKNQLTHTYPKYNPATGWQVMAQPNGDLVDVHTKKEYYALFWEAQDEQKFQLSEGFSVAGSQTADFLDAKLAELGLNRREANEFIMYWLPRMENNPYNTIHFAAESYTNAYPLEISPRPDALIRVFMVFQPTNEPVKIPAQTFETPKRKGFTVVEWGGSEQKLPNS